MGVRKLMLLFFLVSVTGAADTEYIDNDECSQQHIVVRAEQCCSMPITLFWGNLSQSLSRCYKKIQSSARLEEDAERVPSDSPMGRFADWLRKTMNNFMQKMREMWERVKRVLQQVSEYLKSHNDGCLLQCLFEENGLLTNGRVDKEALLNYVTAATGSETKWREVAEMAVEDCYTKYSQEVELEMPKNQTCRSGADQMVHCITDFIFWNCPTWNDQNTMCSDMLSYHQRCPDSLYVFYKGHHELQRPHPQSQSQPTPSPKRRNPDKYTQHDS